MWTAFQFPLLDLPPLPIPKYLISSELILGPFAVFITYVFPKEMFLTPVLNVILEDMLVMHLTDTFSHYKNPF